MLTLRERLIGTWRLVSYEVRGADGAVVYPMGQEVDGLIMYVPDGHMSGNLMVRGRAAYTGGAAASATRRNSRLPQPGTSDMPAGSKSTRRPAW